jgi:hypothetical protein
MKEEYMDTTSHKLSRRDFLKTGATGAALAATIGITGCAPESQREAGSSTDSSASITVGGIPETWNHETEVLVIGGGGGGLVAACKAKELGSEVLLIEKAERVGGDTMISSQAAQGFWEGHVDEGDSMDLYLEDMKNSHWATEKGMTGEPLPSEFPLTRAWLEAASAMYDWTEEHGMAWIGFTTTREAWYSQAGRPLLSGWCRSDHDPGLHRRRSRSSRTGVGVILRNAGADQHLVPASVP